ncbi:CvpA family protein [Ramlibacter tataouinensis]|uniref:Colicin V synthesis protein n=1 Tax=Ramlibacter tataouinensis TaxID=94132 RepID=A0A127JZV3_9BURK|nr:CvpA family protein [Ramlibacter tataouinensis]AMO25487.1 colicin V synthesis protein [Ramlibacter tataouinensis]
MSPLDWVFLGIMAASLVLGAWRGLVYEVLSVFSWIAAFILAQWFAPDAVKLLPMGDAPEPARYAVAFVLVFIAVVFAGALVAWLVKKMVEAVGLRPVDRTLGAVFGLLRGAVLLVAVAVVMNMTPLRSAEWWTESKGAAVSTAALKQLKPVLPERFGQYLPS